MKKISLILFILLISACSNTNHSIPSGSKPLSNESIPNAYPVEKMLANNSQTENKDSSKKQESPADSNSEENTKTSSLASWPNQFVKVEGKMFVLSEDNDFEVDELIGEISYLIKDENEGPFLSDYSNYFPEGAKIWSIQGTSSQEAVAVEYPEGTFTKCNLFLVEKK